MARSLASRAAGAVLAAFTVAPAGAAELQHVVALSGSCEMLIIAGTEYAGNCNGSLLQMIYDTGRNGFYIGTADQKQLFAFSGFDGEPPGDGTVLQMLDMVISSPENGSTVAHPAQVTGQCTYGNPNAGSTRVSCSAEDGDGSFYRLEFLTDGSPARVIK